MTKIAFFGSWHGDIDWATAAVQVAVASGAVAICQTGDLGVGSDPVAAKFGDLLNSQLEAAGIPLIHCRGIQDDLTLMKVPLSAGGYREVRSKIWLLEGGVLEIEGIKIAAIGGGTSTDNVYRSEHPAAVVSRDTVLAYRPRKSFPNGSDILISHEAPASMALSGRLPALSSGRYFDDDYEIDRMLVSQVRHYLQPTFHAFGRYETRALFPLAPHDHTERLERMASLGGSDSGLGIIYDNAVNTITEVQVV